MYIFFLSKKLERSDDGTTDKKKQGEAFKDIDAMKLLFKRNLAEENNDGDLDLDEDEDETDAIVSFGINMI